jgi:hypothetical protein
MYAVTTTAFLSYLSTDSIKADIGSGIADAQFRTLSTTAKSSKRFINKSDALRSYRMKHTDIISHEQDWLLQEALTVADTLIGPYCDRPLQKQHGVDSKIQHQ